MRCGTEKKNVMSSQAVHIVATGDREECENAKEWKKS
jgi:hypothetical protein